jgi:hypothetical protein
MITVCPNCGFEADGLLDICPSCTVQMSDELAGRFEAGSRRGRQVFAVTVLAIACGLVLLMIVAWVLGSPEAKPTADC